MAKAKPIPGLDPAVSSRVGMKVIFRARISELWSWARRIRSPQKVRELHDMRIAAKRLRYCFEFFEPHFGGGIYHTLRRFKKLQDYIGEIHDCDAWIDYLRRDLRTAFQQMNDDRKQLKTYSGAEPALDQAAQKLAADMADGPAQGLLLLMRDLTQRRSRLYNRFIKYWDELEARGFKQELLAAVAKAAKGQAR